MPFTNRVDRHKPRHRRHHVWPLAGELFPEGEEVKALCKQVHVTSGEDLVHVSAIAEEAEDIREWLKGDNVCSRCGDRARDVLGLDARPLTEISGVGPRKAQQLRNGGFDSIPRIRAASQRDLSRCNGIGNALAARIKADVGEIEVED